MLVFPYSWTTNSPSNFAISSTGNDPPYQICDDESDGDSDNTAQCGDEHDFEATRSKKKKLKNGDSTKDIGKAVDGNGKRQGELKQELDQLLLSYQQKLLSPLPSRLW